MEYGGGQKVGWAKGQDLLVSQLQAHEAKFRVGILGITLANSFRVKVQVWAAVCAAGCVAGGFGVSVLVEGVGEFATGLLRVGSVGDSQLSHMHPDVQTHDPLRLKKQTSSETPMVHHNAVQKGLQMICAVRSHHLISEQDPSQAAPKLYLLK